MSAQQHFFGRQSVFWTSMNTLVAGAILCSLMLIAGRAAIDDQPQRVLAETDNQDAVRQLHAHIDAAWNAGDAHTFADHRSEDGTVTNPMGQTSAGRTGIETDIAGQLMYLKGTTHTLTISSMYWPAGGVAVVDGDAEIRNAIGPEGAVMPPLTSKFTSVCVEQPDGEWRVAHLRSYIFLQPEAG